MTHFSQRYAKIPTLEEFEVAENVGIAFDFTTVTPKTVNVIQQTYPALKILFKEAIDEVRSRKDVFKFKRIGKKILSKQLTLVKMKNLSMRHLWLQEQF